jgi:hypothetical protein
VRPGSNKRALCRAYFAAVIWPVSAGDTAFRMIARWMDRSSFSGAVGGGSTLEDAAVAGALGVLVPKRFAPLVEGRWDRLHSTQHALLLDQHHLPNVKVNEGFLLGNGFRRNRVLDYYCYILPPACEFHGYRKYKVFPASSILRQLIAIVNIVSSCYRLYRSYISQIDQMGLSAPYLIVIPYAIMSLINLFCSLLVGSYTQVSILPMWEEDLPLHNASIIKEEGANRRSLMATSPDFPALFLGDERKRNPKLGKPKLDKPKSDKPKLGQSKPGQAKSGAMQALVLCSTQHTFLTGFKSNRGEESKDDSWAELQPFTSNTSTSDTKDASTSASGVIGKRSLLTRSNR